MINRLRQETALYCDTGPYTGMYRVDVSGIIYMTPDEFSRYRGIQGIELSFPEGNATVMFRCQDCRQDKTGPPLNIRTFTGVRRVCRECGAAYQQAAAGDAPSEQASPAQPVAKRGHARWRTPGSTSGAGTP